VRIVVREPLVVLCLADLGDEQEAEREIGVDIDIFAKTDFADELSAFKQPSLGRNPRSPGQAEEILSSWGGLRENL